LCFAYPYLSTLHRQGVPRVGTLFLMRPSSALHLSAPSSHPPFLFPSSVFRGASVQTQVSTHSLKYHRMYRPRPTPPPPTFTPPCVTEDFIRAVMLISLSRRLPLHFLSTLCRFFFFPLLYPASLARSAPRVRVLSLHACSVPIPVLSLPAFARYARLTACSFFRSCRHPVCWCLADWFAATTCRCLYLSFCGLLPSPGGLIHPSGILMDLSFLCPRIFNAV